MKRKPNKVTFKVSIKVSMPFAEFEEAGTKILWWIFNKKAISF